MKRFNIVVAKEDGGVELYPMKQWLRQHQQHIPGGMDATSSTSHQLRDGLSRAGWSVQEIDTEIRLIPPGGSESAKALDNVLGDEIQTDETEPPEASFGLEFQLRDFIAQNIDAIDVNGRKLKLYVDPTGRDGIEYSTDVGFIDILAVDESGVFVVIELKRARSPDHAIGQLARYMGWVKQTIGAGRTPHGIIVAKEIGRRLRYAVAVMPNVELFEYEVEFHLKLADDIS